MKMYKVALIILLIFGFFMVIPKLEADIGPKPSADITIKGINTPYYFDILVKINKEAKILTEEEINQQVVQNYYRDDYPEELNGFKDDDGYMSYILYCTIPHSVSLKTTDGDGNHTFHLGYYGAPQVFKIVIYTESGIMITSKEINRRMFNSIIVYDLSGVDFTTSQDSVGRLHETIPYPKFFGEWLVRLLLTLFLEIGILYLFNYRLRKSFIFVGIVNLITQTLITVGLLYTYYGIGGMFSAITLLFFGEIVVISSEVILYLLFLKEHKKPRAFIYALIANFVTIIYTIIMFAFLK